MHKKRPFLVHVPKDMYRKRPFLVHIYRSIPTEDLPPISLRSALPFGGAGRGFDGDRGVCTSALYFLRGEALLLPSLPNTLCDRPS